MKSALHSSSLQQQRGVSLLLVLVMILLSVTAVTGAFRVATLNEALLGNTSDYQRTYTAAETLMRDAEMDIRGRFPPYTTVQADGMLGTPCKPDSSGLATLPNYIGCRQVDSPPGSGVRPWFPRSSEDYDNVGAIVLAHSSTRQCKEAICVPGSATFYTTAIENDLTTMMPLGAYYGQFTGISPGSVSTNPVLTQATTAPFARYWIEVLRYSDVPLSGTNPNANIVPDPSAPYVYRITVVAQGRKQGSRVVLKSVFVPNPAAQNR